MSAIKELLKELEAIDKEEAYQSWEEHGCPHFDGTILEWYRFTYPE